MQTISSNVNALVSSEKIQILTASIGYLSRTLILQQFSDEQRIRSEGNSGLTNVRRYYDGNNVYNDGTYSNGAVASIHDHWDNGLIVGIGEIQAVLNSVEFQTGHNNLNMSSPNLTDFHAIERISRPPVPPERNNYTDYFQPILCYLEGTDNFYIY